MIQLVRRGRKWLLVSYLRNWLQYQYIHNSKPNRCKMSILPALPKFHFQIRKLQMSNSSWELTNSLHMVWLNTRHYWHINNPESRSQIDNKIDLSLQATFGRLYFLMRSCSKISSKSQLQTRSKYKLLLRQLLERFQILAQERFLTFYLNHGAVCINFGP